VFKKNSSHSHTLLLFRAFLVSQLLALPLARIPALTSALLAPAFTRFQGHYSRSKVGFKTGMG